MLHMQRYCGRFERITKKICSLKNIVNNFIFKHFALIFSYKYHKNKRILKKTNNTSTQLIKFKYIELHNNMKYKIDTSKYNASS